VYRGKPHPNVTTSQFSGCTMGPVSLRYSNWYWVSTTFDLVIMMLHGGCRLLKDYFVPQEFWADVEKYQVSNFWYYSFVQITCDGSL